MGMGKKKENKGKSSMEYSDIPLTGTADSAFLFEAN